MKFPKPAKREKKAPKRIARRKRPPRRSKRPLSAIVREAFRLHSLVVRDRDRRCVYRVACHDNGPLECSHKIRRVYKRTAFDLDNAVASCRSCHAYYTHRQSEWAVAICARESVEHMQNLERRSKDESVVVNRAFLEAKLEALRVEARRRGLN